jgi:penicillin-binding protein 1C
VKAAAPRWCKQGALVLSAILCCASALCSELTFEQFKAQHAPSDGMLQARDGQALDAQRFDMQARRLAWVSLDEVSPAMVQALLAAEDKRFFAHGGVDWLAVSAALWQRVAQDKTPAAARGASTISMQVAAMLDPQLTRRSGPRSEAQKWQQIDAARQIEQRWSKTQILEAYLNTVSFRGELQGLRAASWGLFDKAPSGLDRQDSALLAALIRAPGAAATLVGRRACDILAQTNQRTASADAKTPCDARLLAERLRYGAQTPLVSAGLAPHAARRLVHQAQAQASSLDMHMQRAARDALQAQLVLLHYRGVEDGAVVVLDNRSGQVLAHVGSSGGLSQAPQVDAADAPRQAGSTLKPFLYALAMDRQLLTAASLLDDSPVALATDVGLYAPRNYDLHYVGPVSVRRALGSSFNVPAVRALTLTGVAPFHRLLGKLGISSLRPSPEHYGFSLALGAADVTLLSLTNAYRALANGGQMSALRWTTDAPPAPTQRVISAASAWMVSHILADNAAREHSFGFDSVLATPFWTAVKTGTSKDMRDNWCIGFSEHYTVGVWVGNASGAPMRNVSGVSGAAPAWAELMLALHKNLRSRPPPPPAGVVARELQFEQNIEAPRTEWFSSPMAPHATRHVVQLAQTAGRTRITTPQDGALVAWDPDIPTAVQGIVARHNGKAGDLRWSLNGQPLPAPTSAVASAIMLPLRPGHNVLTLWSPDGERVDAVRFSVRGMPVSTPDSEPDARATMPTQSAEQRKDAP